jgi:ABC-2 type transport system permease protein
MPGSFGLYRKVFDIGLQNTLVYRWNFLVRAAVTFVPLAGSVFLWRAVFAEGGDVAGYTYRQMIAYFLAMIVLDAMTSPIDDDFQIASDIRDGLINVVLLKPMNYLGYRLSLFLAGRSMYCAVIALPMAGAMWFLGDFFADVPVSATLLPALLAALGSAILQFSLAFALAMLAFWMLEIASVVFIIFALESAAGGHVFPLDLLPAPIYHICMALPFAYQYYFPVAVFLGRIEGAALLVGFAMQASWIVIFLSLGQALWQMGLRKYTAVGG